MVFEEDENKNRNYKFLFKTLQGQSAVSDPLKTPPEVGSPEKINFEIMSNYGFSCKMPGVII